jgi:PAS domain S-box-containing protein/putative nucleotidyltransferase with HDIG domain
MEKKGSEKIIRSVFEKSVLGIYLITPEKTFITANQALARLLGYESTDTLLQCNDNLKQLYVKPDQWIKTISFIQEDESVSGYESQVYKKDGSTIWVSENVNAVLDSNGNLLYYVGMVEDITARKEREETLRKNETDLRKKLHIADENRKAFIEMIDDACNEYNKLDELFFSFIETIVHVLDERRAWMKGHSARIASYALIIAKGIGLEREELKTLRLAALLHDIGSLFSHDDLLKKQSGLTSKEYFLIKKHPVEGVSILNRLEDLKEVIPIIKHHHERIDGKGYPDGLKGEDIPLCARILHLAESYDSMTMDRPYRPAPGKEFAFSEFRRCNNTQFDPRVAEVAMKVL